MKRTRSQPNIDFPAKKSTPKSTPRSKTKLKASVMKAATERVGRRYRRDQDCNDVVTKTPAKRRLSYGDDQIETPSKRRKICVESSPAQADRMPLSPRNNRIMSLSTKKMNLTPGASPAKRALTFSAKSNRENCPESASTTCSSPATRSLNFTSTKRAVSSSTLPSTPSKFIGLRGCESPLRTPTKSSQLLSPVKNMNSPLRANSILLSPSPVKSVASPVNRRIGLLSPSKRFGSPVKRIGLESPRKESAHSLKMRLVRQEGACYQKAKQALHTALPEKLLCREKEYKEVNEFLDSHLSKKKPGSMYISGAPGTGKTAVLSMTLNRVQEENKYSVIYINCMSFKNSTAIYNRVLSELDNKESKLSAKDATKALEVAFTSRKSMVIMILDEVDQLDSKNQEVLYTMFEWPTLKNSKLVLIGIANALDLTDRVLPRLQAHPKCKPQLMSFTPYTKDQLVTIITDRLSKVAVNGEQVMEPAAIQFCARKVASQAGDMRKALDVCRRAVEVVEADVKKQKIIQGAVSPSKQQLQNPVVPKKIGVGHILKIINEVYGNRVTIQADQTVPLQQKLLMCTMLLLRKRNGAKFRVVTLGKLHESFTGVCKMQGVAGVDQSEFHSMCVLLESRGILSLSRSKDTRNIKITLRLDEQELEKTLQDKTLMSSVLAKGLK